MSRGFSEGTEAHLSVHGVSNEISGSPGPRFHYAVQLLLVLCGIGLRSAGFSGELRQSATGSEATGMLLTLVSSLAFSVMNIL